MTKYYGVLISTGAGFHPVAGWDSPLRTRREAEECADRARSNDGWIAKVIEMSEADARANGWL